MDGIKIYGLCIDRLKHQIANAGRISAKDNGAVLLESYESANPKDLIDILELYDIGDQDSESVQDRLAEMAETASALTQENLKFGHTPEGYIGLYLKVG